LSADDGEEDEEDDEAEEEEEEDDLARVARVVCQRGLAQEKACSSA